MLWSTDWTRLLLWHVSRESVGISRIFKFSKTNLFSTVSGLDYDQIEKTMKRIVTEEQPFERLEISKEDLLRLFGVNAPWKIVALYWCISILFSTIHSKFAFSMRKFIHQQQRSIGKLRMNHSLIMVMIDLFRCGPLIDLCRGPHIRNTGKVKAFAVTKVRKEWEERLKPFYCYTLEFIDILGGRSSSGNASASLRYFLSWSETIEGMEASARRSCEKKPSQNWSRTRSLLLSWAQSWLVLLLPEGSSYLQQTHRISSRE